MVKKLPVVKELQDVISRFTAIKKNAEVQRQSEFTDEKNLLEILQAQATGEANIFEEIDMGDQEEDDYL